ncbi:MAG: MFS transporter [Candidatus Hodarchaeota archaeon]
MSSGKAFLLRSKNKTQELTDTMSFITDIFKTLKFSVIVLYIATFFLRFAAYLVIALIGYMIGDAWLLAFVIMSYSIFEILTVSFFGVIADQRGRRPVLIISHLLTTIGVVLYAILGIIQGAVLIVELLPILIIYIPLMFIMGAGAASKVSSTLTMIADESTLETRAQYMGWFDIATLGGFGAGFAVGHLLDQLFHLPLFYSFSIAAVIVFISLVLVIFFVKETKKVGAPEKEESIVAGDLLFRVINVIKTNKDLQKLLPVYIPMISLYGLLITFTKELIKGEFAAGITNELIVTVGVLGVTLCASLVLLGKLSDHYLIRRPFIIIGLVSLGILITLFQYFATQPIGAINGLYQIWPVVGLLGFGTGGFPPAILAYLTDISKKDTRGTLFGVYSVIFGSGMIFGPFFGALFHQIFETYLNNGALGIVACVILFVISSCLGTVFLTERAETTENA